MELTADQLERYSRQIILKEIGTEGQKKLLSSKVLVIGAGGVGSAVSLYLAAAGVGTLGIADADTVCLSNLQRQILHGTEDLGARKTDSARTSLEALNPDVKVVTYDLYVDSDCIRELIKDYDFVVDATDNFASKYLINDACAGVRKPFCHGGICGFCGQIMTYVPDQGPCFRCVFKDPPPEEISGENRKSVLGAVAGMIGCMQAAEAVKYLTGAGGLLTGRMLFFDALSMESRIIPVSVNRKCKACGRKDGDTF